MANIQTDNVSIDLNGFKLGGLGGGSATAAVGIFGEDRSNITIRNGSIRGFLYGISLIKDTGTSSGHLIEDVLADGNRNIGILVAGATGIRASGSTGIDCVRNVVRDFAVGQQTCNTTTDNLIN